MKFFHETVVSSFIPLHPTYIGVYDTIPHFLLWGYPHGRLWALFDRLSETRYYKKVMQYQAFWFIYVFALLLMKVGDSLDISLQRA